MKLPNAQLAIVDREKVVEYLLNPIHPDNGGESVVLPDAGVRSDRLVGVRHGTGQAGCHGRDSEERGNAARQQVYCGRSNRDTQREGTCGTKRLGR